jgi:hypothetical protein
MQPIYPMPALSLCSRPWDSLHSLRTCHDSFFALLHDLVRVLNHTLQLEAPCTIVGAQNSPNMQCHRRLRSATSGRPLQALKQGERGSGESNQA